MNIENLFEYDRRDTHEFKQYVEAIRALLKFGPATTRMIHEALGYQQQHDTLDALEWIGVEAVGILPTRYKLTDRVPIPDYAAVNYGDFKYLYPHRERGIYTEREDS